MTGYRGYLRRMPEGSAEYLERALQGGREPEPPGGVMRLTVALRPFRFEFDLHPVPAAVLIMVGGLVGVGILL